MGTLHGEALRSRGQSVLKGQDQTGTCFRRMTLASVKWRLETICFVVLLISPFLHCMVQVSGVCTQNVKLGVTLNGAGYEFAQNPVAKISRVDINPPSKVAVVGSEIEITIFAKNDGGQAIEQDVQVAFPQGAESISVTDESRGMSHKIVWPGQEQVSASYGTGRISPKYPLVCGWVGWWQGGAEYFLKVRVKPRSTGIFNCEVKTVAMVGSDYKCVSWDPASGEKDQQFEYVQVHGIQVVPKPTTGSIQLTVNYPLGGGVTPDTAILYYENWREFRRLGGLSSNVFTFTDLPAGVYHAEVYKDDMWIGTASDLRVTAEQTTFRTIKTLLKRTLSVTVYYSDGSTPLPGATIKVYSYDGDHKRYDFVTESQTESNGRRDFTLWPTTRTGPDGIREHYKLDVYHAQKLVGAKQDVNVNDSDNPTTLGITTAVGQPPPPKVRVYVYAIDDSNRQSGYSIETVRKIPGAEIRVEWKSTRGGSSQILTTSLGYPGPYVEVDTNSDVAVTLFRSPPAWVFAEYWDIYQVGWSQGASRTFNVGTTDKHACASFKTGDFLDVSIEELNVEKSIYQRNEQVKMWVRFRNRGNIAIREYKAEFTIISPSGSKVFSDAKWGTLKIDPGGSDGLETVWQIPRSAEPGFYTLQASVTVWENQGQTGKSANKGDQKPGLFQVMIIPSPTYPKDRWERIWYIYSGDRNNPISMYLGLGPDQANLIFDDYWDGLVAYGRTDLIGFISSRTVAVEIATTWQFTIGGDDGVRLYVYDSSMKLILEITEGWKDQAYQIYSKSIPLVAGEYKLLLEWYEWTGGARVSFNMLPKEPEQWVRFTPPPDWVDVSVDTSSPSRDVRVTVKITFPTAGYRVPDWGTASKSGNVFTSNAIIEKWTGAHTQAVTVLWNVYSLGSLGDGQYRFDFNANGNTVKTKEFTVKGGGVVRYQAYVEGIGWQDWVSDGAEAGTTGKSLRMEAVRIVVSGYSIRYQAHVQGIGWQDWVSDGAVAGTTGQALRIEAIKIELVSVRAGYHVYYRAYVEGIGWQDWVSDGAEAGTTGKSLRMEAIRIELRTGELGSLSHFDLNYLGKGDWENPDGNDENSVQARPDTTLTMYFSYKEGNAGNQYVIRVYAKWDETRVMAASTCGGALDEIGSESGGGRWDMRRYTVPSKLGKYEIRVVYRGSSTPPTWNSYDRLLGEYTVTVATEDQWVKFTPPADWADIGVDTSNPSKDVPVTVRIVFPTMGYRVLDWGIVARTGDVFTSNAIVEKWTGAHTQVVTIASNTYSLGPLGAGQYRFSFNANGNTVKTKDFEVPLSGPDVRITNLTTGKATYRPGENITVIMEIKNSGSASSQGRIWYKLKAEYHLAFGKRRFVNVGVIGPGETKKITESDYEPPIYGWYGDNGVLRISAQIVQVDDQSIDPPIEASTEVKIHVENKDVTLAMSGARANYTIEDLKMDEVRSYRVKIEYSLVDSSKVTWMELTIRRVSGGLLDWDEKVDVKIEHWHNIIDGTCDPFYEPVRFVVDGVFKRFDVTVVHGSDQSRGLYRIYPECPYRWHRIQYSASKGWWLSSSLICEVGVQQ